MENNLPSILGGMAQGFTDFGKGLFDMFGTGGASVLDLIESAKTGNVTNRRQDDFRKWLYQTDSTKDAAAKGLGAALNGVQTVADYIPGVNALTQTTLGNAAQGALGGLADELKTYGEDYDLGRAGQRAAISAAGAVASGGLADALKGSNNALLSSNTVRGLARGATGGAISGGGYAAIDGGDVLEAAKQGAGMGALIGGATGAFQDFKPSKTYNVALTDDERAARIANAQKQIDDIGAVSRFSNNPDDIAKRARITELQNAIKAYQSGYDTVQDYTDAMAAKRANRANTQSATTTQGQVYAPSMGEMEYGAPIQDGYTRLYRGMTQEFDPQYNRNAMDNMNGYESWTDNYDLANRYGDGKYVYSIDVPTSRIANSLYDENPNSATYGDRNFISAIDKAAGLDDVDGNEYLLNTNDELRSGLTYNRVNAPRALETTLADADMAVNSAKIAPGQLGLFDDMPTQTPKTGTRQASLFDQPQESAEPVNPYAPVDGKLTQAMKDRYWEVMKNAGGFGGAIDNELYNKIDRSTLPKGYDKLQQLLDSQMGEGSKVAVELRKGIGTDMPLNADLDKLVEYVYGDEINGKQTFYKDLDESVRLNRKNAPLIGIDAEQAEADAKNSARNKLISRAIEKAERKVIDDVVGSGDSDDIMYALQNYRKRGIRTGSPGALDTVLSERLGIAPGNTVKVTDVTKNDHLSSGALGRYARSERNIALSDINSPEGKVSTMAHERLHSFQNESRPESAGRYSPEVAEAYKQLQKDLGHYYKSNSEIKKRYGRNVDYWASSGEQESRMFQQYLENKGYTDDSAWRKMSGKADEWGNEINPAFDKFIDKLRDLSKRGVALPALAALFGGGAYMASQENDKEKEVK